MSCLSPDLDNLQNPHYVVFYFLMTNSPENSPNPEMRQDTSIIVEPELLDRLAMYSELLKQSEAYNEASQAEMLLSFGISEASVEGLANTAIRAYLDGALDALLNDDSDSL